MLIVEFYFGKKCTEIVNSVAVIRMAPKMCRYAMEYNYV